MAFVNTFCWPFIENVELHLISSAFGLAMLPSTALGTGRRGTFTLSLPNVPTRCAGVYPEYSRRAIFCARDFCSATAEHILRVM